MLYRLFLPFRGDELIFIRYQVHLSGYQLDWTSIKRKRRLDAEINPLVRYASRSRVLKKAERFGW